MFSKYVFFAFYTNCIFSCEFFNKHFWKSVFLFEIIFYYFLYVQKVHNILIFTFNATNTQVYTFSKLLAVARWDRRGI